jgi:hypothetical protein
MAGYHLLALMKDIGETDGERTPVDDRTIDYFIDAYLERYANADHHLHLRFIDDPNGKHVGRNLTREQVRGIFAGQSEWILAEQLAKRKSMRVVSVERWNQFCKRVRKDRRAAVRRGEVWGMPFGERHDEEYEDQIDLTRFPVIGKDMAVLQREARKLGRVVSLSSSHLGTYQ